MTVHNISFTESLLDKKNLSSVKEESKVITPPKTEEKPDEFVSSKEEQEVQEKPNHKVRNWAIGMTSAVTLAGFVLAGRTGKLGKGIQKFLGGAEKEVNHATGHSNPHIKTEKEPTISKMEDTPIPKAEEPHSSKVDDIQTPEKTETSELKPEETPTPKIEEPPSPKTEEPPIQNVDENPIPKTEEPTIPKADDVSASKVDENPTQKVYEFSTEGLTPKQIELNAKLNRIPPQLDDELLHVECSDIEAIKKQLAIDLEEIEKVDISKYTRESNDLKYRLELPDGKVYIITRMRKSPNEITNIFIKNKGDSTAYSVWYSKGFIHEVRHLLGAGNRIICEFDKTSGKINCVTKEINYSEYKYDSNGNIESIIEDTDIDTGLQRKIYFYTGGKGKGKVERIEHYDDDNYLKTDYFGEDGQFVNEAFPLNIDWQ